MCQHVRVKYQCGHLRYCVLCWCSRYTDKGQCCPLKVRRNEYLAHERCGCCRDTNSLSRRKRYSMDPKALPMPNPRPNHADVNKALFVHPGVIKRSS